MRCFFLLPLVLVISGCATNPEVIEYRQVTAGMPVTDWDTILNNESTIDVTENRVKMY